MIIRDVYLSQLEIVAVKYLPDLFELYAPGCAADFAGAKQEPAAFNYRLRFLVDEECLAARMFPAPDYELGADFVIEDEDL